MPNTALDLRKAATAARTIAFAPYSNFKVGAAIQSQFSLFSCPRAEQDVEGQLALS